MSMLKPDTALVRAAGPRRQHGRRVYSPYLQKVDKAVARQPQDPSSASQAGLPRGEVPSLRAGAWHVSLGRTVMNCLRYFRDIPQLISACGNGPNEAGPEHRNCAQLSSRRFSTLNSTGNVLVLIYIQRCTYVHTCITACYTLGPNHSVGVSDIKTA